MYGAHTAAVQQLLDDLKALAENPHEGILTTLIDKIKAFVATYKDKLIDQAVAAIKVVAHQVIDSLLGGSPQIAAAVKNAVDWMLDQLIHKPATV